ncbi:hypothetical protein THRCLA_01345 [Thraustotheca clavata]|uniref:Methyltransferase domain-containing protein n=1 Tax=Thraustotheca clavata TaxID=74557 RepID=A0A1W0A8I8_9STRA|nr:hypothetical protein THRCLA_01345 [Thraustotheca clavata]
MTIPASISSLIFEKDVLVLGAGQTQLMQSIMDPAQSLRVVDSRGVSWHAVKRAQFERSNPFRVEITQPVDLVWSNVDMNSFVQEDIVQFCQYVTKLSTHAIYAFNPQATNKATIDALQQHVEGELIALHPALSVVLPAEQENVVAVWSDRKMPLIWRDSVYANKCRIMSELYEAQKSYIKSLLTPNSSYVEVGCGTSEMGSYLYDQTVYTVGVEINRIMLELAREIHPEMNAHPNNYLLEGNALELQALLKAEMPANFWNTKRVVAIVMNTFGILPEHIRQGVVDSMLRVAGDDGVVVIGCWHADSFRRGVEEYYMKNPLLVGDNVTHEMCDYANSQLYVPSTGYESHWWSEAELRKLIGYGYSVDIKVIGIGIFLTARKL